MPGAEDFLTVNILKIKVQLRSESVKRQNEKGPSNGGLGKKYDFQVSQPY